jgi:hypothetical protein
MEQLVSLCARYYPDYRITADQNDDIRRVFRQMFIVTGDGPSVEISFGELLIRRIPVYVTGKDNRFEFHTGILMEKMLKCGFLVFLGNSLMNREIVFPSGVWRISEFDVLLAREQYVDTVKRYRVGVN